MSAAKTSRPPRPLTGHAKRRARVNVCLEIEGRRALALERIARAFGVLAEVERVRLTHAKARPSRVKA